MRAWNIIEQLDFSLNSQKLQLPAPEGMGWTKEQAEMGILWYRRFLKICAKYPKMKVVPNHPVDEVWHTHVLETRRYGADCERLFGRMLHHYPFYGMRGDANERDESYKKTNEVLMREFGENFRSMRYEFTCPHQGVMCDGSGGGGSGCRAPLEDSGVMCSNEQKGVMCSNE